MSNFIPSEIEIYKMTDILSIASDGTRLKIMFSLWDKDSDQIIEKNVSEIINDTGASQSLISHQLKILKEANLVSQRRSGRKIYYSLVDEHVIQILKVVLEHAMEK